jgi:fructoselysine-6-P-deglycase FrlB-like protein
MNPDGFLADVLAEPATLAALADDCAATPPPAFDGFDRVVLIGMGSSRFAALTIATALRARGVDAVAEYASTQAPSPPRAGTLAVGISASGKTPETVAALERHQGASRTLALTNHPERALGELADEVVPLRAGEEAGGIACKTYQATLALLLLMSGTAPDRLRRAAASQQALFDARETWLPPLLDLLDGAHTIYAIAPATRISSSLESALMFREAPRIPADGSETGDWTHVDVYMTKHPQYRGLLFPGSSFDGEVMQWATERMSSIVAIGTPVPGTVQHVPFDDAEDPVVAALLDASVAELAAAELWRRFRAEGRALT